MYHTIHLFKVYNTILYHSQLYLNEGFPGSSAGKEFACNVGNPGLISGSGRSPGEELGYPLQCSWASLVAQMVKNPPAMQETRVQFPGLGRCPEGGHGNPLQYSCLENPHEQRSLIATVHGVTKSQTRLRD